MECEACKVTLPETNADKVSTMTDIQLAELYSDLGGTEESWLEWLREDRIEKSNSGNK